ncbi:MAG: asparagine synthase-related protein [Methylococcaceae bacterium]
MFAGLLSLNPSRCPASAQAKTLWGAALSPYHQPDQQGFWQQGPVCLLEQRVFNAPANRDAQVPLCCPYTGVALAFWGRLDNRDQLAAALREVGDAAASDAQLVLAAWRRWGEALPEHLLGDFVLAVMDAERRRVFLARDPLGVKPLYYQLNPDGLAFATSVAALRVLSPNPLMPDSTWMARYLLGMSMSDQQTGYRDLVKLPPGHCLTVSLDSPPQLRRWHHWRDDAPSAFRRDPQWVEAYRAVLEESIRCRMGSDFPLGTENSGGLDSATITAYLAHFMGIPGERLHSFGFALGEQEPAFILETSQALNITHNYIITACSAIDDTDERIDRALRILGYPEEHGSGSGHTLFYRECELRGIRTLFSGYGGDEVVTNPGRHLRWELLDQHQYQALWDIVPGNPLTRSLRVLKAATLGRNKPAYNARFLAAWQVRWPHQLLQLEWVQRLDLHTEYMEGARYDAPYRKINDFILQKLLKMPYVATRLENCTLMAASYGIDYRWPLWDVRLVQQYLSTPGIEKVGPKGIGRYLHRRAIDKVVPKRVAWKPSKNMGYGQLLQDFKGAGLIALVQEARQWEADLHPDLSDLIDRPKLRLQLKQAEQGTVDDNFAFSLQPSARSEYPALVGSLVEADLSRVATTQTLGIGLSPSRCYSGVSRMAC